MHAAQTHLHALSARHHLWQACFLTEPRPCPHQPSICSLSTPAGLPGAVATPNTASARSRPVPPLPPSYASHRSSAPLPPATQQPAATPQDPARGESGDGGGPARPEKENGVPAPRGETLQGGQAMGPPPVRSRCPQGPALVPGDLAYPLCHVDSHQLSKRTNTSTVFSRTSLDLPCLLC